MPVYTFDKIFSANTTESTHETVNIDASVGIITELNISFPAGCINKVFLKIFHRGRQILPTNPDGSFNGDDEHIDLEPDHDIAETPSRITIKGWNTDTNTHQVTGRLVIKPKRR